MIVQHQSLASTTANLLDLAAQLYFQWESDPQTRSFFNSYKRWNSDNRLLCRYRQNTSRVAGSINSFSNIVSLVIEIDIGGGFEYCGYYIYLNHATAPRCAKKPTQRIWGLGTNQRV